MAMQRRDFRFGKDEVEKESIEKLFGKSYEKSKTEGLTYGRKVNRLTHAWNSLKIKLNRFNFERKTKESINEKQITHLKGSIDELLKEAKKENDLALNKRDLDVDIGVLRNASLQTERIIEKLEVAKVNREELKSVRDKFSALESMLASFVEKRKGLRKTPQIPKKTIVESHRGKNAATSSARAINTPAFSRLPPVEINLQNVKQTVGPKKTDFQTIDGKSHQVAPIPISIINDGNPETAGRLLNMREDQFIDFLNDISTVANRTKAELNDIGVVAQEKPKPNPKVDAIESETSHSSQNSALLIQSFAMTFFAFMFKSYLELGLAEKEILKSKARKDHLSREVKT